MSEGFELLRPAALLLLLLAWPWIRWSTRREPLRWRVGGLAPFASLAASGGRQRAWPWSLIAGLSALLCATLAAAGMRRPDQPALWLVDGSVSFAEHPLARTAAWQPPVGADALLVRPEVGAVRAQDLMDAARRSGAGRPVVVLTDLPPPPDTPETVDWRRLPGVGRNTALLDLEPAEPGWSLRWARWGGGGPAFLAVGEQRRSLAGEEGRILLEELAPGEELRLVGPGDAPWRDDHPQDDVLRVPPPVRLRLPEGADPRWGDAVRAAWPGATIARPEDRAGVLAVSFAADGGVLAFDGDPFVELPELEAVARIAERLAPSALAWNPPRAWSECAPPPASPAWGEDAPAPVVWRDASRAFAAVGLALYLLSLLLRRAGR